MKKWGKLKRLQAKNKKQGAIGFTAMGFISLIFVSLFLNCEKPVVSKTSEINTSHLDALYEELIVHGDSVGVVHIYSEYPDYHLVGDPDEGIACVDDASRAAIFYLRHYMKTSDKQYLQKGKMLIRFLLAMQSPNGYYYNFIFEDGRINKEGNTSLAEPNFWSWRTLWAFGEALEALDPGDPLIDKINVQRNVLVQSMLAEKSFRSNKIDTAMGIGFATWLPQTSGADQASIILTGLSKMLRQPSWGDAIKKDTLVSLMEHMADGIIQMQIEEPDSLHDGAFLSWENLWHAYANIQSYALLKTGDALGDAHMISHALYEIDHFYPAILKAGGLEHFFVSMKDGKISRHETSSFPQIAYGRRPMIWASLLAYDMTKDEKYFLLAKELAGWFSGNNSAQVAMYDPATGRGYDGISGPEKINKNAGGESTIEALLSLQALESYQEVKDGKMNSIPWEVFYKR